MTPNAEETQKTQATNALAEFVRIIVKEYPLVFKDGSGAFKLSSSKEQNFPYEVSLEVKKAQ